MKESKKKIHILVFISINDRLLLFRNQHYRDSALQDYKDKNPCPIVLVRGKADGSWGQVLKLRRSASCEYL